MIRVAEPSDAPAMGKVLSDWIDATPWMPRLHARTDDAAFCGRLVGSSDVWVACAPEVVGFLARHEAEVDALYLAETARRQGWGGKLLDTAKSGMAALELWTFQANHPAIAFYAAAGFREIRRTDGANNDEKLPDCRMRWERTPR